MIIPLHVVCNIMVHLIICKCSWTASKLNDFQMTLLQYNGYVRTMTSTNYPQLFSFTRFQWLQFQLIIQQYESKADRDKSNIQLMLDVVPCEGFIAMFILLVMETGCTVSRGFLKLPIKPFGHRF